MKGFIRIDPERCKGCSLCMEYCPGHAINLTNRLNLKGYFVADFEDKKECTGCAVCAVMCPEVAIEVYQIEKTDERQ
jgi:2-oxoglutarate ferredoxin oxidoreductase subunit delta